MHSRQSKKKSKSKLKIPIVKFFKSGKNELTDSDSSDDERRASIVTYGSSQLSTSKEDTTDKEELSTAGYSKSSLSIDQVEPRSSSIQYNLSSDQVQDSGSSLGFNDKFLEVTTDDEDDAEDDHGFETDGEISDDSEFTDLDNDTILESYSRSDSISNALDKLIQNKEYMGPQFSMVRKKEPTRSATTLLKERCQLSKQSTSGTQFDASTIVWKFG